ncbi:MAG: ABC transporter permease, partial [Rhodospirillales bacterium]|nr:ABC transporter permease [Rhodospirillales bacterium]
MNGRPLLPLPRFDRASLPVVNWQRQRGLLISVGVFLVMLIILQLVKGEGISYFDVSSITTGATTLALAAVGETIVILAGGFDLSAGAVISLVNVMIIQFLGGGSEFSSDVAALSGAEFIGAALALALAVGAVIGAINGFLIAFLGLSAIVVTLATMFIAQGAALLVMTHAGGEAPWEFSMFFTGEAIAGVLPAPIIVLAVVIALWLALRNSRLGTGIYAIGSDEKSARASGTDVRMTKFWTYTIAGVCYGAAGMFMTAQIGAGDPLIGAKFLLKIFAAVVIGGTLIGGGRGGCVGTVFGALTLTIILTIFLLLGMRTWYVPLAEGAILIFAVLGLSMSRDLPVVDVVRGWRQALATRWRSPVVPSAGLKGDGLLQDLLGRTAARGGPDLTRPTAGWFTRNQATLRYISPTYVMFAVIVIATVVIFGGDLSALEYLNVLLLFTAFLAILGLGQGAVIISGGLDLSVAWAVTFPAIVVTTFCFGENGPAYWAVPLALAIGLAIGFLNGIMIVLFSLSPIIVTLAMAGMLEGISLIFSDGAPIGGSPPVLRWFVSSRLLGLAPIGWFLIAFAIVATIFLNRTAFGRRLYTVGNSVTVARLSGVWTGSVIVGAYMLSGFCSALVGVLLSGFSGQAFFGMGDPFLLQSIAVVVLGGTLITGGRGHFVGILGGALLFTALGSLLTGTMLPEAVRSIIYGL